MFEVLVSEAVKSLSVVTFLGHSVLSFVFARALPLLLLIFFPDAEDIQEALVDGAASVAHLFDEVHLFHAPVAELCVAARVVHVG